MIASEVWDGREVRIEGEYDADVDEDGRAFGRWIVQRVSADGVDLVDYDEDEAREALEAKSKREYDAALARHYGF